MPFNKCAHCNKVPSYEADTLTLSPSQAAYESKLVKAEACLEKFGSDVVVGNRPRIASSTCADSSSRPRLASSTYADSSSCPRLASSTYADSSFCPRIASSTYADSSSRPRLASLASGGIPSRSLLADSTFVSSSSYLSVRIQIYVYVCIHVYMYIVEIAFIIAQKEVT